MLSTIGAAALDLYGIYYVVTMDSHFLADGQTFDLDPFISMITHCGMFCNVACFIMVVIIRHKMTRVVRVGLLIFIPLEMLLLIGQDIHNDSIFISMTYVIPIAVFYFLFHSNPFDEITGLQNSYSMEACFEEFIRKDKPFFVGYLIIPAFNNRVAIMESPLLVQTVAEFFRISEKQYPKIRIYQQSAGTFTFLYEGNESEETIRGLDSIAMLIRAKLTQIDEMITCKMVAIPHYEGLSTMSMVRKMVNDLTLKMDKADQYRYLAKRKDYDDFMERYEIIQELTDIRLKKDPEDPRILCYAQPIYEVKSKSFHTAEALMRLELNGRMVSPVLFIPIAESTDCIHALTLIMLHKVCRQISKMQEDFDFDAISVNCSAREFSIPGIANEYLDILDQYKIDRKKVRLELTESAVADDNTNLRRNMNLLEAQGILFYLDDFGTGYSSMTRLIDLPFRTIKFDKTLLYKSLDDDRMDEMVSNIIGIMKKNHIVTLVEGVESDDQSKYSIERGFEYIQGFHYAKPVPIEEMTNYFQRKNVTKVNE